MSKSAGALHATTVVVQNVSIDHRGTHILVAGQPPELSAIVGAILKQMRGEGYLRVGDVAGLSIPAARTAVSPKIAA